jgi:hypothetical protein
MVACLSLLTSLGGLTLEFESPQSHPDRESRRPPPSTRTVLPALTLFWFKGDGEYLEDLVARVDAPRLNFFGTTFFNDIDFDVPQFIQFISRMPTLEAFDTASVDLTDHDATIRLTSNASDYRELNVGISCEELHWQVSFLAQVCTSSLPPLSVLEDLYITNDRSLGDDINNSSWLELLHPFTVVKNLYLSEAIAPHIVPALQELVAGRVAEVLPNLQNIFVEKLQPSGPVQEGVEKFVAARQFTSHPITVSHWDRDPSRPQVPRVLDLYSDALCINPAHLSLPSPVTLAPKPGRPIAASEFPDFMAALVASTRPAEIDLSMLPDEGPTIQTAHIGLDSSLGTSADRPIELDLEGMDIDTANADVSLSGDEPPNDIPTANPLDNTTTTGGNNPSPPSLLEAFHRATAIDGDSQASVTALPFDMIIDMDNIDFPSYD